MIDFDNRAGFNLEGEAEPAAKVKDLLIDGEAIADSFKTTRDGLLFTNLVGISRVISANAL